MDTPVIVGPTVISVIGMFFFIVAVAVSHLCPTENHETSPPRPIPLSVPELDRLPTGLVVRMFREDDFDECRKIYASIAGEFVPPQFEIFENSVRGHPNGFLVAELDGVVIACAGVSAYSNSKLAWFWMGLVQRSFHGRGIGTVMLMARLALLRHFQSPVMLETTAKTEPFYRKFGFVRCSDPEKRYLGDHSHFYMCRIPHCDDTKVVEQFMESAEVEFRIDFDIVDIYHVEEVTC